MEKAVIRRFTEYYRSATKERTCRRSHGPTRVAHARSHHGTDFIPIGINRFKKVNWLILSRYRGVAGVCIDLAKLPLRSQ